MKNNSSKNLPKWATSLHKLSNLHQVDEKLFRSEQLEADEAVLLTEYQIDAVINLRFFDRNDNEQRFAEIPELADVDFYNYPLMAWYVTPERIAEVLWRIVTLHEQGKNVLVHCYHGADRTGIIIAMYRTVIQGWSVAHAHAEMTQGNFGYHAIWRNLENMLNEDEVNEIKQAYHEMRHNIVEVVG